MTKEEEPNYLKMAIDSMVDKEVEGPRVILGPTALKNLVNRVRNAALEEAAVKCDELRAPEEFNRTEKTVWDVATLDCGAAIRNLKEPTP